MKRDFTFLKFLIGFSSVFGWASLIGGIFSFLVIMFFANPGLVITSQTLSSALAPAGWGLIIFVIFCSWAEFLKVVLAIEENTRKM